jgi:hypothetical protein
MRDITGVEKVVGKINGSHFEIRPTGAMPDGALALPKSVFESAEADAGHGKVLIAKESAHESLDGSGVLP